MNMPRTTVDILLPLDPSIQQQIRTMRAALARGRSERGTREAVRSMLDAWVADTRPGQLVIR